MIAKITVTTDDRESFEDLIEKYKKKYQEIVEKEPSISYTMFIDEDNLQLTIKTLDLEEAVN